MWPFQKGDNVLVVGDNAQVIAGRLQKFLVPNANLPVFHYKKTKHSSIRNALHAGDLFSVILWKNSMRHVDLTPFRLLVKVDADTEVAIVHDRTTQRSYSWDLGHLPSYRDATAQQEDGDEVSTMYLHPL